MRGWKNSKTRNRISLHTDETGKTYLILKPSAPNANANGYVTEKIIVKTWYFEKLKADKLYRDNYVLNSDWKEYNESVDEIEFKEESGNYVIIINASVESGTTATIDVTNKTDEERFYDNKNDVKNLFNPTK